MMCPARPRARIIGRAWGMRELVKRIFMGLGMGLGRGRSRGRTGDAVELATELSFDAASQWQEDGGEVELDLHVVVTEGEATPNPGRADRQRRCALPLGAGAVAAVQACLHYFDTPAHRVGVGVVRPRERELHVLLRERPR